ncbi:MAG: hypothetical protein LBD30_05235, partial [Verrucomicrobiales bacterium]|nr:hypothetical protein [Verrucomicrobiales bacterium]
NVKAGNVKSILTPGDVVFEVRRTKAGGPHTSPEPDEIRGDGKLAMDGNIHSKHFNAGQDADGGNPRGVNTGLVITPRPNHAPVTAIQFATANDMVDRDPLAVTVEGADNADGPYTLIYRGSSGLLKTLERGQWGGVAVFENTRACKVYRVLVTETRGDNADAVQFGEVRLGTYTGER